jgi:hypothetical protein
MLMPIIVELTYEDDTKETFKYPANLEKKNDTTKKVYTTKRLKKFVSNKY